MRDGPPSDGSQNVDYRRLPVQTFLSAHQTAPFPRVQETLHHEDSRHPRAAGSSLRCHNECWCASETGLSRHRPVQA